MSENRGRMKAVQKNNFVALMADIVMNRSAADMTSNEQKFMWLEITNELNEIGPAKTMDQWKRCWTDIKSTVKEKVARGDKKMTKVDMQVIAIMNKERKNGNIDLREVGLCSAPSSSSLVSVAVASKQPVKGMLLSENKTRNIKTPQISDSVSSVSSRVRNPMQFFDDRGFRRGSVERTSSSHGDISWKTTNDNGQNQTKNIRKRALTIIGDIDSPRAKTVASINLNKPPSSTQTSRICRLSSVQSQLLNTQCFDDRGSVERTIVGRNYPHNEITSKLMKVYGLSQTQNIHNRASIDIGGIDTPRTKPIASVNLNKNPATTQISTTGTKRLQSQLQSRADLEGDGEDPLSHSRKSVSVVSRYDSNQVSTEYVDDDGGETQLPNCERGIGNGLSFLQSNYLAASSNAKHHRSTGTFSGDENCGSPISGQSDESWAENISSANSSDGEDSQYEDTVNRIVRTRELERIAGRDSSTRNQDQETVNRIVRTREIERSAESDPSIGSKNSGIDNHPQQVPVNNNVRGQERRTVRRAPSDENIDVYDSGRENDANEEATREEATREEASRGNTRGRGRGGSRGRARQQYQERRPSRPLSTLADNSIKLQQEGTDILHDIKRQNDVIIEQNKELIRSSKHIAVYNRGILSLLREQSEQA